MKPIALMGCLALLATHLTSQPETVGPRADGSVVLPVNQVLRPAGAQVDLTGIRPQVLALSPDGAILVTSGSLPELIVVDAANGTILERVPFPSNQATVPHPGRVSPHILEPDHSGQASFTGLAFSPDGSRLVLSDVDGPLKVFAVDPGHRVMPLYTLSLPPTNLDRRPVEIPTGVAFSRDGRRLYVAGNVSNRLFELDALSGRILRTFPAGVAPYDVLVSGRHLFVSNWGGRRPAAASLTGPAGLGLKVRVDPVRYIASEGSVTIVDTASGKIRDIRTGLHTCALATPARGTTVFAANAGSDSVSELDASSGRVYRTIHLDTGPSRLLSASPNALAVDSASGSLYVACGTLNAIAVLSLRTGDLRGLIPTGWYPGAVVVDRRHGRLCVANIKGIGAWRYYRQGEVRQFNSHQAFGTLSLIPLPGRRDLSRMTDVVRSNNRDDRVKSSYLGARRDVVARPVPERTGEPSVFAHLLYIIKENRTYDQVLGDIPEGNGEPSFCLFGEAVTPNIHRLAREFALLDNTYCCSVLSADGHEWADSAFATDYVERSFAGWPRSYPDGMLDTDVDALAYSAAGFLWDNAIAHHVRLRDYGEFTIGEDGWSDRTRRGEPGFLDYYSDFLHSTQLTKVRCRPAIASLRTCVNPNTVGWDLAVPDVIRADRFIQDLHRFEKAGQLPQLITICLPNDHTSGTRAGSPTPAAQVADNDLALGRIVEAVSHSRFWRDSCILVIEDDPQSGVDHVSGYRTEALVVSPYTRHRGVVRELYNQTSLVRTIELILGLPAMNRMDAAATPMSACFTKSPDFSPFESLPNRVPLDQMNPSPDTLLNLQLREDAIASAQLPLQEPDRCPEDLLNHILWRARKGAAVPFPEPADLVTGSRARCASKSTPPFDRRARPSPAE